MTVGELFQAIPDGVYSLWRGFLDTELESLFGFLALVGMLVGSVAVLGRIPHDIRNRARKKDNWDQS